MPALEQLLDGYHRFRTTGWSRERERWSELAEGQNPGVMVIACSDSRVDPATIFDSNPGEMFFAMSRPSSPLTNPTPIITGFRRPSNLP
jgi:carbonic anhydrase